MFMMEFLLILKNPIIKHVALCRRLDYCDDKLLTLKSIKKYMSLSQGFVKGLELFSFCYLTSSYILQTKELTNSLFKAPNWL